MELELTHFEVVVQHFSHNNMGTPFHNIIKKWQTSSCGWVFLTGLVSEQDVIIVDEFVLKIIWSS